MLGVASLVFPNVIKKEVDFILGYIAIWLNVVNIKYNPVNNTAYLNREIYSTRLSTKSPKPIWCLRVAEYSVVNILNQV